jgi:hypothetical protein
MSAPKPPPEAVLARAAELRAAGNGWEVVAQTLRRSLPVVRRWPDLFPDRWQAATRLAERRLLSDASAESVLVLRQLLRSNDDKVRRDAARLLVSLRLEQAKLDQKAEPEAAAPTPDRLFAEFLEAHTDEQLEQLAASLRNAPLPSHGDSSGSANPGAD